MSAIHTLIVDDHVSTAEFLGLLLEQTYKNIDVTIKYDGFEALDVITQTDVDVIITDYNMPGMDGLELVESIRKLSPNTQIIVSSAYTKESLKQLITQAKVDHFMAKPIDRKTVDTMMKIMIENVENIRRQRNVVPAELTKADVGLDTTRQLDTLRRRTNAHCCFIVDEIGYLLAQSGGDGQMPLPILASLAAANAVATAETSSLLGNPDPFHSTVHEGSNFNVASYSIDEDTFLIVIFDKQVKIGVIQHYARKTINHLANLLKAKPTATTNGNGKLTKNDFTAAIDSSLDELFMIN